MCSHYKVRTMQLNSADMVLVVKYLLEAILHDQHTVIEKLKTLHMVNLFYLEGINWILKLKCWLCQNLFKREFFFQLQFIFNIILCKFQVNSIGVRQSYALQSVPPDISSTQLAPYIVIMVSLTTFLMLYFTSL